MWQSNSMFRSSPLAQGDLDLTKIYVGWFEGDYGSGGYLQMASLNRFDLVKHSLEKALNQNMQIEVFDSKTMQHLYDCDCLIQYSDKTNWCTCPECKNNDETVRYLVETKQGNYTNDQSKTTFSTTRNRSSCY